MNRLYYKARAGGRSSQTDSRPRATADLAPTGIAERTPENHGGPCHATTTTARWLRRRPQRRLPVPVSRRLSRQLSRAWLPRMTSVPAASAIVSAPCPLRRCDIAALACEGSAAARKRAEELIALHNPTPVWAVSNILLSPDLLGKMLATLNLSDYAAAAVCKTWACTWREMVRARASCCGCALRNIGRCARSRPASGYRRSRSTA